MSEDTAVIGAALRRAGVIELDGTDELVLAAMAFANSSPMRGRALSVVADGGGHATLGADAAERAMLRVEPHSIAVQDKLKGFLLPQASTVNPVDLVAGPDFKRDIYQKAVAACLEDPGVNAVLLAGSYGGWGDIGGPVLKKAEDDAAIELVALRDRFDKPVVVQSMYASSSLECCSYLLRHGIPVVEQLAEAVKILDLKAKRGRSSGHTVHDWQDPRVTFGQSRMLQESEARAWLADRIPGIVPPWVVVAGEAEAVRAAAQFDGPVVLKILAASASHKSDVGGVIVNLRGQDEIAAAWRRIAQTSAELGEPARALITPFVSGFLEAMVGMIRHIDLGPVVLIGSGGLFAEALMDRELLFPPFEPEDVENALSRLFLGRAFRSARAEPQMISSLVRVVQKVGDMCLLDTEVVELDLNPVLVSRTGATILDVRVAIV